MLSNAYFLAKFRFDTAENEPAKNSQTFCKIEGRAGRVSVVTRSMSGGASSTALLGRLRRRGAGRGRQGGEAPDGHADAAHGRQEGGRGDVREALVLVQGELLGWLFTFLNSLYIFSNFSLVEYFFEVSTHSAPLGRI